MYVFKLNQANKTMLKFQSLYAYDAYNVAIKYYEKECIYAMCNTETGYTYYCIKS